MREQSACSFGMARSHAIGAAQSRLVELCAIATEATGVPFRAYIARGYRDLADALETGDVALAWMPPIPAIELDDKGVASPLVLPSRGEGTTYHSAFVVRSGGPRSLAELRGRRVAWVDRESAAGYLAPRLHLASLGFDPRSFFAHEAIVGSHLGAVDAVVSGAADVGATFCSVDPRTKRVVTAGWTAADGATLRSVDVVATAGPIPNDAIVAATRLPAPVRASVTRWLLDADARSRALLTELFHVQTFKVAARAHFEPLRHMLRTARARGYDAL